MYFCEVVILLVARYAYIPFKSSTRDLAPRIGQRLIRKVPKGLLRTFREPRIATYREVALPSWCAPASPRGNVSLRSSVDSDLEAFSHNPADGSFAPLAFQPSANAKCLNRRFLSY